MPVMKAERSALLLIDFQAKLMPVIDAAEDAIANAVKLTKAAALFDVPRLFTVQNPAGLGGVVPDFGATEAETVAKMTFGCCGAPAFDAALPDRPDLVVAGCETHVCVLQTVLGLLKAGRRVFVVADAGSSRTPASKAAGLARMERHGAEIVTAEMVIFDWRHTADHPTRREARALLK